MKYPFLFISLFLLTVVSFFSCGGDKEGQSSNPNQGKIDSLQATVKPLLDSARRDTALTSFVEHLQGYQAFIQEVYTLEQQSTLEKLHSNQLENYEMLYRFFGQASIRSKLISVEEGERSRQDVLEYTTKFTGIFAKDFEQILQMEPDQRSAALNQLRKKAFRYNTSSISSEISEIRSSWFQRRS